MWKAVLLFMHILQINLVRQILSNETSQEQRKYMNLDIILNETTNVSYGQLKQGAVRSVIFGGVNLRDESAALGSQLRSVVTQELGVNVLQEMYDGLQYEEDMPGDSVSILAQMVQRLERKLARYMKVLRTNKIIIENLYPKKPSTPVVDCCSLQDSQLRYEEQYGTAVSRETSCDLVPSNAQPHLFNPGRNLTDVFQHITQLSIKWQYFISKSGVHNEFPAHNFANLQRGQCAAMYNFRHRAEYVSTIYPQRKNVVLLIDTGSAHFTQPQLDTAKQVANLILDSLNENDRIGVLSVDGSVHDACATGCTSRQLCALTYESKLYMQNFIRFLTLNNTVTKHEVGIQQAFQLIWNTLNSNNGNLSEERAMIAYMSPGLVSNLSEATAVLRLIARENARLRHQVVINTYLTRHPLTPVLCERTFLEDLASQNLPAHGLQPQHPAPILTGKMVSISSQNTDIGNLVSNFSESFHWAPSREPRLHLPSKDREGRGLVLSMTSPCLSDEELVGVVGLDLHLADIVEDITYFPTPHKHAYAFLIDTNGYAIMHPSMPRPYLNNLEPIHTNITQLEPEIDQHIIYRMMLQKRSGRETVEPSHVDSSSPANETTRETTFTWRHVRVNVSLEQQQSVFILVIRAQRAAARTRRHVGIGSGGAAHVSYHRLDLLPAQNMCMHLKSLATTDSGTLFLAANSFLRPFDYLSVTETKQMVKNYMAYLKFSDLIATPDDKEQAITDAARRDAAVISRMNQFWLQQYKTSTFSKYIVRRYVATPTGALFMFPGTLLSKTFDATTRHWFRRAMRFPGKLTITAPYLDQGGAGYIVTISHTVFEGKADGAHEQSVAGVLGMDVTLGALYVLLRRQIAVCERSHVRCFLMDHRGYLLAHPALLDPRGPGPLEEKHITHKEALIAADILSHEGFVQKMLCNSYGDRTVQRYYHFNTSEKNILTNLLHGEHCSQYQVSAVAGTNVFVGIVNQTCSNVKAFCPCSVYDRRCLNCARMEQSECECPCECGLRTQLCGTAPPTQHSPRHQTCAPTSAQPPPVAPHIPSQLQRALAPCHQSHCHRSINERDCIGLVDCQWCSLDTDGATRLARPFCATQRQCYAGVIGAPTPYGDHILPHETRQEKVYPRDSTPVGPVAGGLMACLLVMALAMYCYCQRVHQHQRGTGDAQYRLGIEDHHEEFTDDLNPACLPAGHTNIVLATFDSPSVSPYRVNAEYQRPVAERSESDLGYSTMTPHEDSEIASTTCTEPIGLIGRQRYRPTSAPRPSSARGTPVLLPPPTSLQSRRNRHNTCTEASLTLLSTENSITENASLPNRDAIVTESVADQTMLDSHQISTPVQVHIVDLHA